MKLSRENAQILSTGFFAVGLALIFLGRLNIGLPFVGIAVWTLLMTESVLLLKVQNEMRAALDGISQRRESEIQDLLYFLRQSQLAKEPFETIEGAKKLCSGLEFPAMILTTHHQIILANPEMHDVLGYKTNELIGKPAHLINDPLLMSMVGELCSKEPLAGKKSMITQYAYLTKQGEKVFGQMDATKISDVGFFVVFHPESSNVLSYESVRILSSDDTES